MSDSNYKPSDFAKLGQPMCSRWSKSEIEWLALAYVQALAKDGDVWKRLTRAQVHALLTEDERRFVHAMLTLPSERYQERFDIVADQITDSDGALGVRGFWSESRLTQGEGTAP
jgi:hypothetical protein